MATLTVAKLAEAGLDTLSPAFVAANAGGDSIPGNKGRTFLYVKNGSGGALVVTATPPLASVQQERLGTLTRGAIQVSVPGTGGERLIGPFPPGAFNDTNGAVAITYSGVTSLTVKAFELPAV